MSEQPPAPARRSLWRRIVGDASHVGFWTLPVFIATALGGAVIAAALANVYYAQQVAALEEETRAARAAAEIAAEEIDAAREEALAAIDEQVDSVRDALEIARPLADPSTAGLVVLTVELTPEPEPSPSPSPSPSDPQPSPGGDGEAQGSLDPAVALATTEGEATEGTGQGATPTEPVREEPPAPVPGAPTRTGVGFVVAIDGDDAFVATSFGLVADPNAELGVAPAVSGSTPTASGRGIVHAWDEARHLAVIRVPLGAQPILPWRPARVPLSEGDVAVLAAVTQSGVGLQLPGRVGAVTASALVTDLPVDPVFDGAPLLDAVGRVIGVQASTSSALGAGSIAAVPAQQLCVELISGCGLLEQADPDDEVDEGGGDPAG